MPIIRSRPDKLNDADTILYEIYMLHFAAGRLKRERWDDQKDAWAYLEAFLLHYRNLIEFLGKTKKIRPTDLHVTTIWKRLKATPPKDVSEIHREGVKLWAKYGEAEGRISQYLQHCTTKRIEPKDWRIDKMSDEIKPLLDRIVPVLQPHSVNPLLEPVRAGNAVASPGVPLKSEPFTPSIVLR